MEKAYQKTTEEIYKELETSEKGLTNDEAKKRVRTYGQNILAEKPKKLNYKYF